MPLCPVTPPASVVADLFYCARQDRRPVAPATVAKMIVRDKQNNPVDVESVDRSVRPRAPAPPAHHALPPRRQIDPTFFVVTVDLWSDDGIKEMNLVLHPSSADRHAPSQPLKHRRRGNTGPSGQESPLITSDPLPTPSQYHARPPGETPVSTPRPAFLPS
jgi:hypothetical protein